MRTTIVFKNAILRINFHVHFVYVLTVQPAIEASTFSGRYSFMNMSAQSKWIGNPCSGISSLRRNNIQINRQTFGRIPKYDWYNSISLIFKGSPASWKSLSKVGFEFDLRLIKLRPKTANSRVEILRFVITISVGLLAKRMMSKKKKGTTKENTNKKMWVLVQ